METLLQDIRFGSRALWKNPGFSVTAVLTLSLAIAVTTAVFSVIDAVLIRPLPFNHPEQIFSLETRSPQGYTQPASYPEYRDWRQQSQVFSALAGYNSFGGVNFEGPSGAIPLPRVLVTDNFFDVFGVKPLLGRTFAPGEDQAGKNDLAVLSYEVWQQDFGGRRDIIGESVKLGGRATTIVGVMPAGFRFPLSSRNTVYTPLHMSPELAQTRGSHWLPTIARLKNGISPQQAEAGMNQVLDNLGRVYPNSQGRHVKLVDISSFVVGNAAAPLKVLVLAVLTLLAIGCANIAGLLLARGVKREKELAVRSALGASRGRVIVQLLGETLPLAVAGAVNGVLLATVLLDAIRTLLLSALARGAEVQIDQTALIAALSVAVITTLVAALAPALGLSQVAPRVALTTGTAASAGRRQHRLRSAFILAQLALALVLVATSGLLLRLLAGLRSTDLGFDPNHLLTERIDLSRENYKNRDLVADFYRPLVERLRAIPGVKDAGVIQLVPIRSWGWNSDIQIAGHAPAPRDQEQLAEVRVVSSGYFKTMDLRLLRGRLLDERLDTASTQPAVVVNEEFVKKFFPDGEDPMGKQIQGFQASIVGVVQSARQDIYQPPLAEMDISIAQLPSDQALETLSSMNLLVRTSGPPQAIIPSLRQVLHDLDPGLAFRQPETMRDVIADVLIFERLENWLFGTFAVLALLLAIVGLYGLISQEVELSTREIGLRVALGASRAQVLAQVYRRAATMVVAGLAVGLFVTVAGRKLLSAVVVIHDVRDIQIIVALACAMFGVALLAVFAPAYRAASADPMIALRYE